MAVMIGIPCLVFFIFLVMGIPLAHYLKRDFAYDMTKNQPKEVRIRSWYGDY